LRSLIKNSMNYYDMKLVSFALKKDFKLLADNSRAKALTMELKILREKSNDLEQSEKSNDLNTLFYRHFMNGEITRNQKSLLVLMSICESWLKMNPQENKIKQIHSAIWEFSNSLAENKLTFALNLLPKNFQNDPNIRYIDFNLFKVTLEQLIEAVCKHKKDELFRAHHRIHHRH
ncbi:hypothetical protein Ciccas_011791, partial [Cichlidogyrus casuarinus]